MRLSVLLAVTLPLICSPHSLTAETAGVRLSMVDLAVNGRSHLGQTVTVGECYITYAAQDFMTCGGFSPADRNGLRHLLSHVAVDSPTADRLGLRKALSECADGERREACLAFVTGVLRNKFETFGSPELFAFEIRNATIRWVK